MRERWMERRSTQEAMEGGLSCGGRVDMSGVAMDGGRCQLVV